MKTLTKLSKIFLLFFLFSVFCSLSSDAYADISHLINYQGKLTDPQGKPVSDGTYSITFRIYDAESAGSLLWEETQSVNIQKGVFSVLLGGVTALDLAFDKPYFLEIKVKDEVMSPRQRLASSAYAFRAEHGVPRGVIVMWSGRIADIPSGWVLCDGSNGTPDLRDRFIVGARQDDGGVAKTKITGSLMQSAGSVIIAEANLPSHTHSAGSLVTNTTGIHTHSTGFFPSGDEVWGGVVTGSRNFADPVIMTSSAGDHSHTVIGTTGATGSGTAYTPPYYALAYIMKL